MTTYHLDLLEHALKNALERYCVLCDSSPEREYFSNETIFSQTKEIIHQYIRLFQAIYFLDHQTEYYYNGFVFTHQEAGEVLTSSGKNAEIVKLLTEAYQRMTESISKDWFFMPIHVQQIHSGEIHIFIGVVTKKQYHCTISVVTHHTVYPRPSASIGNNRFRYLLKLLETYEPDDYVTLEAFVNSKGLLTVSFKKTALRFSKVPFTIIILKLK